MVHMLTYLLLHHMYAAAERCNKNRTTPEYLRDNIGTRQVPSGIWFTRNIHLEGGGANHKGKSKLETFQVPWRHPFHDLYDKENFPRKPVTGPAFKLLKEMHQAEVVPAGCLPKSKKGEGSTLALARVLFQHDEAFIPEPEHAMDANVSSIFQRYQELRQKAAALKNNHQGETSVC